MGCRGNLFYSVLITISVALVTYNAIVASTASLKSDLPGRRSRSPLLHIDPAVRMPVDRRAEGGQRRLFHTAVTASDSVYNAWQCRVMYYWFKKAKSATSGSEMGGFTRILHSGRADKLMDEIPTFVADPLPAGTDQASLLKIAPTWMNISLSMKKDPEADKAFGWVLEMYAYAVASALHGVGNILHKEFMIQPPWDLEVGDRYIIHYTYGCDYDMMGKLTYGKIGEWRFDKRSYTQSPPPKNLPLPPHGVPESVVTLVKMVNEATANIPNWDAY